MERTRPLLFALAGLLGAWATYAAAATKDVTTQVTFRRPGMGIGGGSYTGIVVRPEDDKRVNTCAITRAVAGASAGFVAFPAEGFENKQPYKTDYGRVTDDLLGEYNKQNGDTTLQRGPIYGLVYEVSYDVRKGFVVYHVRSELYYGGKDSAQWYKYSKKYNDTFFSRRLLEQISQHTVSCAKEV